MHARTLTRLALALTLALSAGVAATASAAELKTRGEIIVDSMWGDGGAASFRAAKDGGDYQDKHHIEERARLLFDFVASENLKFTTQFQIGSGMWGQGGFGLGQGDAGTGKSTAIRVREAYLDLTIPDTEAKVKAGYMLMYLPSAYGGSPILSDEAAGAVLATTPLIPDTLSLLVGYARLWDTTQSNNTRNSATTGADGYGMKDELDAAILSLPVTLGKTEITPWMVYAWGGKNSLADAQLDGNTDVYTGLLAPRSQMTGTNGQSFQKDFRVWWTGLAASVQDFDPIVLGLDFNYGSLSGAGSVDGAAAPWDSRKVNERAGWYLDGFVGYTGLEWVKPELFFAYSSGEDADPANGSERLPILYNGGYALGTSWWLAGSNFGQTDMGGNNQHIGFWALGFTLKDIATLDKLTHDVMVMYAQGTNSASLLRDPNMAGNQNTNFTPGHFLTTKDKFWEFDLNTKYALYDELTAILELGFINMHCDQDLWNDYQNGIGGGGNFKASNAYKVAAGLKYAF